MKLSEIKKIETHLFTKGLLVSLLMFTACKQNDFYQKKGLSEVYDDANPDDLANASSSNPAGSNSGSGSSAGGTGNGTVPSPSPSSTPTPAKVVSKSEVFTQNLAKDGDVDILWIIDNSGSMADKQKSLADNFSTFITHFAEKEVNFKMGITTTDATSNYNGRMVGDTSKLTYDALLANKNEFISNFKNYVNVGTKGSGREQGLKTAMSFMDRYASSFLRKDAYLTIVILSDEEDQSDKSKEEYLAYFKSLKSKTGMVKVYSIVTQKLTSSMREQSVGTRYNWVADQTNGVKADIYGNFATTLDSMGTTISNLVDTFALSAKPIDGSIKVYVNGVENKNGWTFDTTSKVIKFKSTSIPVNGSKIEIAYQTLE